jgi:hypothetical protein
MSNWIQNAQKHPGALHSALGVRQGEKIPVEKINKKIAELRARSGKLNPAESKFLKRLLFAQNMHNINKG